MMLSEMPMQWVAAAVLPPRTLSTPLPILAGLLEALHVHQLPANEAL